MVCKVGKSQAILIKKGSKEQGETEEREDGNKDCR
jgi:hypothetical protein